MQSFIKPGDTVTYTAPTGGVVSGQAYLVGGLLVVAANTVAQTLPFEGRVLGVFNLAKATGSAWTEGQVLYWDNTAFKVTTVSTANFRCGVAAQAQASGDTIGMIRLDGIGVTAVGGVAP